MLTCTHRQCGCTLSRAQAARPAQPEPGVVDSRPALGPGELDQPAALPIHCCQPNHRARAPADALDQAQVIRQLRVPGPLRPRLLQLGSRGDVSAAANDAAACFTLSRPIVLA